MSLFPLLSYDEAQDVGAAVHDYWLRLTGEATIGRDNLGWADLVQFVTRKAWERVVARQADADDRIRW
jgi:hypothetical protein